MADVITFGAAFVCALGGMAYLALAMDQHFEQVIPERRYSAEVARRLRVAGAALIALSLLACSIADHVTMVPLVWVMMLTASAIGVAFILAYQPRMLVFLGVPFAPRANG